MTTKRDKISSALFALLQTANGPGPEQFQFNTFLQRAYAPGAVPGANMPIAMLVKTDETIIRNQSSGRGLGLTKYGIVYKVLIYDQIAIPFQAVPTVIPENEINQILNALDYALTPTSPSWQGECQTLGGLVEDVWIEGNIEIAQPILDDLLVISIPIHILAGRLQVMDVA